MHFMTKSVSPCILYVGTYPPRECGIATFTQDLTNAIDKEFYPEVKSRILAINDTSTTIYNYPRKVIKQINETDIEDYLNRANEINRLPQVKLVNIQHEYGIFGGDWGNYILPFLELLKKPAVITMHTVLPTPTEFLKKLTKAMIDKSAGVIVMTKTMEHLLAETYGVKKSKIKVIPHGVHHVPFPSKSNAKKKLNLAGFTVLSTFGMLNRDKGIEYAIKALPEVVKEFPNVLYLIIGATHPNIVRREGEAYRKKLTNLVVKLGLQENVKFYNKYLVLAELIDYLKATDIYISPTLNPEQAVSGTLSYALSCACPVISTSNQYARDVINHERGMLVRFRNEGDIKKALLDILADKKTRKEMGKSCYFYSRHMTWQNVAMNYFKLFNNYAKIMPRIKGKLPPITLDYIRSLTDKFGMIQFANHTKPDIYSGYCLDDNARALFGCTVLYEKKPSDSNFNLIKTYLKFIKFMQKSNGHFHNFINYHRTFNATENGESEDSFGRAVCALGYFSSSPVMPEHLKKSAKRTLDKALKWANQLHSLRAMAFTIIGLSYIIERSTEPNKNISVLIKKLSDKLINRYEKHIADQTNPDWLWFEDCLTYSNYKLPEALFSAYKITGNQKYLEVAKITMNFLMNVTFENPDYFTPIGQDGWYYRYGQRAYFDQQPEDTSSAVEALVNAYLITKDKNYTDKAKHTFQWFLGKNHLNQMVYDEATGGCYDGLGRYSLNFNQGAESTISYFLARLAIEKIS